MNHWRLLAIGVLAYAVALAATAPATLADAALRAVSGGRLRLLEARGTLWSGRGLLELRDAAGRNGLDRGVAWDLRRSDLLRGQLNYEVAFGAVVQPVAIRISRSRVELEHADIRLPAAGLGLLLPRLASLDLTGEIRLRIASLLIEKGSTRGDAMLLWHSAGSALSPVSPLGDYEVRFDGQGSSGRAVLRTLQGPLQLDGRGSWFADRGTEYSLIARVPPQIRQQLAPLLGLIAVERNDGSFDLKLE